LDIKIYVANLAKYVEGSLVGAWIDLPCDDLEEQIQKILGTDEEWAIHDYEAPFHIDEYDNVYKLNESVEELEGMDEDDTIIELILSEFSLEEGMDKLRSGDYMVYSNCNDMGDVAREILEQQEVFNNCNDIFERYFDFDAYGRDLDLEGHYIEGDGIIIEVF